MAEKLAPEKRHRFISSFMELQAKHVEAGIKGNPLISIILHITLQKRGIGQTWASPILGQGQFDPVTTDLEQKHLYATEIPGRAACNFLSLQNPGFDFSQAQFSGNCPDPWTFMSGIRKD